MFKKVGCASFTVSDSSQNLNDTDKHKSCQRIKDTLLKMVLDKVFFVCLLLTATTIDNSSACFSIKFDWQLTLIAGGWNGTKELTSMEFFPNPF